MRKIKNSTIIRLLLGCVVSVNVIGSYWICAEASDVDEEALYAEFLEEKMSDDADSSQDTAEGYDALNGLWKVGAIDYDYRNNPDRNMIIDIDDSDTLSDMYDGIFLSFFADGTFVYANPIIHEGTYTVSPKNQEDFVLKTEKCYRLSEENGEVTKIEDDATPSYYLEICEDSLHFQDYDPFTGKAKVNDNGYYFVQVEDESSFIQNNKAILQFKDSQKDVDNNNLEAVSSYTDILESYTEKMETEVPQLVRQYEEEAAGIDDITKLAEICNDKVGKLAEICNEGVGKMADLMYKNGDSYDTYSKWAEKLMDEYIDIAQEIQATYLDFAS